jgi:hypothetical protein
MIVDMVAALLDCILSEGGEDPFLVVRGQLVEAFRRRALDTDFLLLACHVYALLNLGAGIGR